MASLVASSNALARAGDRTVAETAGINAVDRPGAIGAHGGRRASRFVAAVGEGDRDRLAGLDGFLDDGLRVGRVVGACCGGNEQCRREREQSERLS